MYLYVFMPRYSSAQDQGQAFTESKVTKVLAEDKVHFGAKPVILNLKKETYCENNKQLLHLRDNAHHIQPS